MTNIRGKPDVQKIGEIRNNNSGTPMKIIDYKSTSDITVEFLDEYHYTKHTTYSNFVRGNVKNPYDRDLYGVGYFGVGKWKVKDETGKWSRVYLCWRHMLERCYHEKSSWQYPAYYGICTVCEEWKCFQTFADWYKAREYDVNERLHLDKDIKHPGNTVYSPENCILVPQRLNAIFINKSNKRGLPNGIYRNRNKFTVKYNEKSLGVYENINDAYLVYTKEKKKEIIKMANEYKGIIPNEVYDAVIAYEFSIENDKNYVA